MSNLQGDTAMASQFASVDRFEFAHSPNGMVSAAAAAIMSGASRDIAAATFAERVSAPVAGAMVSEGMSL